IIDATRNHEEGSIHHLRHLQAIDCYNQLSPVEVELVEKAALCHQAFLPVTAVTAPLREQYVLAQQIATISAGHATIKQYEEESELMEIALANLSGTCEVAS